MIKHSKLIHKLDFFLKNEKQSAFKNILELLLDNYKKLSKDVEIISYEIKKKSHSVELNFKGTHFMTLNIYGSNIHLIIQNFERMFFLDDKMFISHNKKIFQALFLGEYEIINYKRKNGKLVYVELNWQNNELKKFNQKNKVSLFSKKITEIEKKNGVLLIECNGSVVN